MTVQQLTLNLSSQTDKHSFNHLSTIAYTTHKSQTKFSTDQRKFDNDSKEMRKVYQSLKETWKSKDFIVVQIAMFYKSNSEKEQRTTNP